MSGNSRPASWVLQGIILAAETVRCESNMNFLSHSGCHTARWIICSVWSSYYYLASAQSQGSLGQPSSHGWLQATIRIFYLIFCILWKWTPHFQLWWECMCCLRMHVLLRSPTLCEWVMSCSCKFGSFLPCVDATFYVFLFLIFCMIQIVNG
jgi:hypothetical protein